MDLSRKNRFNTRDLWNTIVVGVLNRGKIMRDAGNHPVFLNQVGGPAGALRLRDSMPRLRVTTALPRRFLAIKAATSDFHKGHQ